MRGLRTASASVVVLAVVLGAAGPRGGGAAWADEGGEFAVSVKEDVELDGFLRQVSAVTGIPILWNPQDKAVMGKKMKGPVELQGTRDHVLAMCRDLLAFYDLVMIPVGPRGHEVHLVMDARQPAAVLKMKPIPVELTDANVATYEGADGLFITTMIRVRNLTNLRDARNAFSRIVTGQNIGNVQEVSDSAFVVTDFAPNVVAIWRLIRMFDREAADTGGVEYKAVAMKHAVALDVARLLAAQFAPPSGPSVPQQPGMPPATAAGPRIQADPRTNQVLLSGTPQDVRRVEDAIRTLDVPIESGATRAVRIPLTNVKADQTAQMLRNLIESSTTLWRPAGQPVARPTVVAHPETNSVVVSAGEEAIASIRRFVQELDVPQGPPAPSEPVATRFEDRRVKTFEWDSRTVHQAMVELARRMDLSMIISPDALQIAQNAIASMRVRDLTLKEVLDQLTKPYGLAWRVEEFGILRILRAP